MHPRATVIWQINIVQLQNVRIVLRRHILYCAAMSLYHNGYCNGFILYSSINKRVVWNGIKLIRKMVMVCGQHPLSEWKSQVKSQRLHKCLLCILIALKYTYYLLVFYLNKLYFFNKFIRNIYLFLFVLHLSDLKLE
jgi:hypothetical protein